MTIVNSVSQNSHCNFLSDYPVKGIQCLLGVIDSAVSLTMWNQLFIYCPQTFLLYSVHKHLCCTVYTNIFTVQCTQTFVLYSVHKHFYCTVYTDILSDFRHEYLRSSKTIFKNTVVYSTIHSMYKVAGYKTWLRAVQDSAGVTIISYIFAKFFRFTIKNYRWNGRMKTPADFVQYRLVWNMFRTEIFPLVLLITPRDILLVHRLIGILVSKPSGDV